MCVFECLLSFSIALYLMFMSLTELGAQGLSRLASQKLKGLPVSGPPVLEFQAQPAVPRSSRVFLSRVFLSLPPAPPMLELQAHAAMPRLFNGGAGI